MPLLKRVIDRRGENSGVDEGDKMVYHMAVTIL